MDLIAITGVALTVMGYVATFVIGMIIGIAVCIHIDYMLDEIDLWDTDDPDDY
jgi:hypothetical protein